MEPSYLKLHQQGKLKGISERLLSELEHCSLCPRNCNVNRLKKTGFCRTGRIAVVSSAIPHFGEEPSLVGKKGSGTIFISWCNLGCIYCQNYRIAHLGEGAETSPELMANMMLELQNKGCHNINFVTPTHVIAQIVEALVIAVTKGLKIPLVYNTGGYDKVETLEMIKGIFDIYLPDAKYSDVTFCKKYSNAPDYWERCQEALIWMYNEVGDLRINKDGIAERGLLIRHLVLPNNVSGSFKVLDFIAEKISKNSFVNIMDQYRPCYKAYDYPEIARPITSVEYKQVVDYALKIGLHRGIR